MSDIKGLWRLQMLEEQLAKLVQKNVSPEIVQELKKLKKSIEKGQLELKDLKEVYNQTGKRIEKLNGQNVTIKEKANQVNSKIYDGSLQNKEIQTYQQRLSTLKKELLQNEDAELELMQKKEDLRSQWDEQKQVLNSSTERYKELHLEYQREKEERKTRVEGLTREVDDLLNNIDPEHLKKYSELKSKHANPVSRVTKNTCSGCHLSISFDHLKQLKKDVSLTFCNNCGRILYWDPQ